MMAFRFLEGFMQCGIVNVAIFVKNIRVNVVKTAKNIPVNAHVQSAILAILKSAAKQSVYTQIARKYTFVESV
jgi:hypothetical protein